MATPKAKIHVALSRASLTAIAKEDAGKLVIKTTIRVLNRAKILTPVDTGNLRASLTQDIKMKSGEVVGRVSTNVNYAIYVHEGTKAHKIYPKNAKALVFYWPKVGAKTVVPKKAPGWTGHFAKGTRFMIGKGYVQHPGTKGRPFLRTALVEEATKAGFVVKKV